MVPLFPWPLPLRFVRYPPQCRHVRLRWNFPAAYGSGSTGLRADLIRVARPAGLDPLPLYRGFTACVGLGRATNEKHHNSAAHAAIMKAMHELEQRDPAVPCRPAAINRGCGWGRQKGRHLISRFINSIPPESCLSVLLCSLQRGQHRPAGQFSRPASRPRSCLRHAAARRQAIRFSAVKGRPRQTRERTTSYTRTWRSSEPHSRGFACTSVLLVSAY